MMSYLYRSGALNRLDLITFMCIFFSLLPCVIFILLVFLSIYKGLRPLVAKYTLTWVG